MPAPLLWLGAACLSIYAGNKANEHYLKHKGIVDIMPGASRVQVTPQNGSIVTCGIYGVLDHTGIWVDGNIYELSGQGLVRCLSPNRFLGDRSGSTIYVACDRYNAPLFDIEAAIRAQHQLYHLHDYHLFNQNCHRFIAETLSNSSQDITSFSDLNAFLHAYFDETISWLAYKR